MPIKIRGMEHIKSVFPGGEVHVKIFESYVSNREFLVGASTYVDVYAEIKSSEDFMELLLVSDALKRAHYCIDTLEMPYLPYARQDRVCAPGEALSASVAAGLINSVGARRVRCYDPHSSVMPALINNIVCDGASDRYDVQSIVKGAVLVAPDAGAEKRVLAFGMPYVQATKIRDPRTGIILATRCPIEKVENVPYIMVDDICDGGRTFIELGKVLKDRGVKRVELLVTHGLFSKGFDVFKGYVDAIHYLDYSNNVFITKEIK